MKVTFTLSTVLLFSLFNSVSQARIAAADHSVATQPDAVKPSAREGHCLVYDEKRRRVILLDGYQPPHQPELGEVWSWDGKRWELLPGSGPAARSLSGAVYDSRRQKIVEFGGVGNIGYEDLKGDTWEWNGQSWRQMTDVGAGTRDHHSMAYDAARRKTVMYGGQNTNRSWAKDTWEWDGVKWTKIFAPGPGGRAHSAMAYDSRRKKVLLFGGQGEDGRPHNDTWEWDGSAWRKVSDEGPPPRSHHRMAFDSRAGVMLLYGGVGVRTAGASGLNVLADMWSWDGKSWTEIKTTGPGKRLLHAMAYDAARGRLVLYGGDDGRRLFDDTWEWDNKQWMKIK